MKTRDEKQSHGGKPEINTVTVLDWDYAVRHKYRVLLAESEIGEFYITPQTGSSRYLLVFNDGQYERHMEASCSIARLIDAAESFVASREILPVEVVR